MRLDRLVLRDFRQFYGDNNHLRFPKKESENVTIVFGANGSGKTTILNAFTWILYQETTPAFSDPENLICERSILEADPEEIIEASVTLEFEHEGRIYRATRTRREKKVDEGLETQVIDHGTLDLQITDETGDTRSPGNADERLSKVLPERLYDFFFFDGERIERLTKGDAYEEIEEAVKDLLGLKLLERAHSHLSGTVRRRISNQLSEAGGSELQSAVSKLNNLEDQKEEALGDLEQERRNRKALENELESVRERLRELQDTRDIQEQIDREREKLSNKQKEIKELDRELEDLISNWGFLTFLEPIVDSCEEILQEKRRKGEIPAGIKRQFVEDLLERKRCICGASLSPGSEHREEVKGWLEKAGLEDVEQRATKAGLQLDSIVDRGGGVFNELRELQSQRAEARDDLKKIQERLSQLDALLEEEEAEPVAALVEKKEGVEDSLKSTRIEIGRLEERIDTLDDQIEDQETQIDELEAESEKEERLRKQLEVSQEAAEFFSKLFDLRSHETRDRLNQRIKDVYDSISYKDYQPEITEEFDLILTKDLSGGGEPVPQDVARATGENQILSLSFIGSIAAYARDLSDEGVTEKLSGSSGFSGGRYPIVMDSPFGALDTNYRKSVAEGIPKLADQLIILVSRSQGLGVVFESLKDRLDRIYALNYHSTKEDVEPEVLDIGGKEVPFIQRSEDGYERAELIEVK